MAKTSSKPAQGGQQKKGNLPTPKEFRAFLAPYTAFFVGQLTVKDPVEFDVFGAKVQKTFHQFNGRHVYLGQIDVVYEGQACFQLTIIVAFPSQQDLQDWQSSARYQKILPFLHKGANVQTLASYNVIQGP